MPSRARTPSRSAEAATKNTGLVVPAAANTATHVPLDLITRDIRLRFRDPGPFAATAAGYAEVMRDAGGWGDFPPVQAVELTAALAWTEEVAARPRDRDRRATKKSRRMYAAGTLVLWSGFARCEAAASQPSLGGAEIAEVPVVITPGTWEDAVRLAWTANARHGRPRSRSELAKILDSILVQPAHRTASGSELARLAGCSKATANRHKRRRGETAATPRGSRPSALNEPTGSPVVVRDDRGRKVPAWLRSAFVGVPAARKLAATMRAAADDLAKVAVPHAGTALADMLTLLTQIESRLPKFVHEACDGEGCEGCDNRGFLSAGAAH